MRIGFYLFAGITGLYGFLSLLRFFEVFFLEGGASPTQLMFGIGGIILAVACLKKARSLQS